MFLWISNGNCLFSMEAKKKKRKVYEKAWVVSRRRHEVDVKNWKGLLETLAISIDEPSLKDSSLVLVSPKMAAAWCCA